jgi:hypothetical protein
MILLEQSMAWRGFHGPCALVTPPFRLTTNWYKLSDCYKLSETESV